MIELSKPCLAYLQQIIALLNARSEKFILFFDDLSFNEQDQDYKILKSVLDGSVATISDNVLIYATSNRRHIVPQLMADNLPGLQRETGEVNPVETVEEKVSLSDRFGLWVSFHPFSQNEYLIAVQSWFNYYGLPFHEQAKKIALRWVIERGNRSGRLAFQFAKYWASQI